MKRTMLLLVLLLASACATAPIQRIRAATADPPVVGQVYCQLNGYLGVYEFAPRVHTSFGVSERAMPQLADKTLVGATIGAQLIDGLISNVNIRQRDQFVPVQFDQKCNLVVPRGGPSGAIWSDSSGEVDAERIAGALGLPDNVIQVLIQLLCEVTR